MLNELDAAKRAWEDAKREYATLRERTTEASMYEIRCAVEYKMALEKLELKKAMARHI